MSATGDDVNRPDYPHWPGDWPGRSFINLDCVGDPGDWLDTELPSVEEVLSQDPQEDEGTATALADAYIRQGQELCFPLPTDFGATPEAAREAAITDFVGFIREWRRRAEAAGCFRQQKSGQGNSVATWHLLPSLGFVPDPHLMSDVMPGLSCDFGNVKVSAICAMNRRFTEIVMFTGVLATKETFSEICFEMPLHPESREQALAWLVWNLDHASDDNTFKPKILVPWLEEGRRHRHTLPWERAQAAYAARPHCSLAREWARVVLKTLAEQLVQAEDDTPVTFRFDGEVLTIRCAGKVAAAPADGKPWPQTFSISAAALKHLPKRLMQSHIEVSIYESALTIGRRRFDGVVAVETAGHA